MNPVEKNPTIFRHQFQSTRQKIKNLIISVKVETRFVYFFFLAQTGWTYFTTFLRAVAVRSTVIGSFLVFSNFKNFKFASCLGKGTGSS